MSEFRTPERPRYQDFCSLNQCLTRWKMSSNSPDLADVIMSDITPEPDDDMDFSQRRTNAARKYRLDILTCEEYMSTRLEYDDIVRGLSEAISIIDDNGPRKEALVTILQVYRIQKSIVPEKENIVDPRRIAFRLLNPAHS